MLSVPFLVEADHSASAPLADQSGSEDSYRGIVMAVLLLDFLVFGEVCFLEDVQIDDRVEAVCTGVFSVADDSGNHVFIPFGTLFRIGYLQLRQGGGQF